MIQATSQNNSGFQAGVWFRAIDPAKQNWSDDMARGMMAMKLADTDRERMSELAEKCRAGSINSSEELELDEYRNVCQVMELLHAKAVATLRRGNMTKE